MDSGFSYQKFFHGNTLMVVIPHEDDEINIAGSLICGAREEGMQVICVFVTNGDYKYIPDVRIREAVRALAVLGVPQEDIVFLGYPDGGGHGEYSVFMHGRKEPVRAHTAGRKRAEEQGYGIGRGRINEGIYWSQTSH